jgi:hypothetical protein
MEAEEAAASEAWALDEAAHAMAAAETVLDEEEEVEHEAPMAAAADAPTNPSTEGCDERSEPQYDTDIEAEIELHPLTRLMLRRARFELETTHTDDGTVTDMETRERASISTRKTRELLQLAIVLDQRFGGFERCFATDGAR